MGRRNSLFSQKYAAPSTMYSIMYHPYLIAGRRVRGMLETNPNPISISCRHYQSAKSRCPVTSSTTISFGGNWRFEGWKQPQIELSYPKILLLWHHTDGSQRLLVSSISAQNPLSYEIRGCINENTVLFFSHSCIRYAVQL